VVQPGDNLSTIAMNNGLSVDALAAANGLSNTNFIWAGQRLTIPGKAAPAPAPAAPAAPAPAQASGSSYTVRAGDNLSTIAAQYGVSVDALAQANGITNRNLLFSGQVLAIPGQAAPAPKPADSAPPPPKAAPTPKPVGANPTPTIAPVAGKTPTLVSAPAPPPDKEKVVPAAGAGGVIKYQVKSGDRLYTIAAQYNTTVDAIVARNNLSDPNVIVPGQTLEILQGDKTSKPASNGAPTPTPRPMNQPVTKPGSSAAPPAIDQNKGGKWIDVNISTQTLTAYEGNKAVFSTLVSTGVSWHPTVVGTYKIYAKYLADDMSGGEGAEYYYLPAVPYTMYFYGGYAIHGTYWHHNFGHPMSHGCVNLPTDAAKWVYNWAPMGTTVVTHW
jgi:LysM repeat protein